MRRTEYTEPTALTDQQIRGLAQTLCGEEYNPKKANALLLLMDDIQRHADAGETSEVITASIITKGSCFLPIGCSDGQSHRIAAKRHLEP